MYSKSVKREKLMSPLLVADSSQVPPSASSPTVTIETIHLITLSKNPDWATQKELGRPLLFRIASPRETEFSF